MGSIPRSILRSGHLSQFTGLNGIPDYISVVLPYAFGLPPSQNFISGPAQSAVTWLLVLAVIVIATTGWIMAIRTRTWPRDIVLISTAWCGAIFGIVLFVTFVDTVWFYATSLSILFWLSIGALPSSFTPRWLALTITVTLLAIEGISTYTHNHNFFSQLPSEIRNKSEYQSAVQLQAEGLLENGVQVIYGSYLDVIPIAYASSFELRPISNRYNRFPMDDVELSVIYTTAVRLSPTDLWGQESLEIAQDSCVQLREISIESESFGIFECSGEDIDSRE